MIIGLYNLEPKIENTAMMQVSQFHKQRGDQIETYNHIFPNRYDVVYAFSIFKETGKFMVRSFMICGGTGFDVSSHLPSEIESCDLDYSIFPKCKTSYIWFSRGCFRNCPFCIVRKKEGFIHSVEPKNLNTNGEYISIMDNSFFANPKWQEAIDKLVEWGQPVDFQSGIDVRIFSDAQGKALQRLKLKKQIHIAWDNPQDNLIGKIEMLKEYIPAYKIMCYVLIGYWSTPKEDMMRVESLRDIKVDPFVMPYNKFDRYQRAFARWVNFKAIFKTIPWDCYHQNPNKLMYTKTQAKGRYFGKVTASEVKICVE